MTIILDAINISPLLRAQKSLLKVMQKEKDEFIRDSAIQRFEYTFELAWKVMKRILAYKGIFVTGTKDIFRYSFKENIISDPSIWFAFLEARNKSSHSYNEDTADQIYEIIKVFIPELQIFLNKIEKIQ